MLCHLTTEIFPCKNPNLNLKEIGSTVVAIHLGCEYCSYDCLKFDPLCAGSDSMDQKSDEVISCRVSKWRFVSKLSESEKLRLHRAAGHLSIPNVSVHCEDCVLTKGAKLGHAKSSDPNRRARVPLEQLNIDFWGPIQKSKDNNTFVIVVICDVSAYVWMYPVRSKDAVVDVVSKLIIEVRATEGVVLNDKVIHTIRSDNEAVFRSNAWRQMLLAANVKEANSAC